MNTQQQWVRKPIEPPAHVRYAHSLGRGAFTFEQIDELVKAINPAYVERKQGLTYLAQHQARAEMNRIFGYGNWEVTADRLELIYETQQPSAKDPNKMMWTVAYRALITVSIRDLWGMPVASYTGVHAEENAPQPNRGEAHALALTSVDSYALRRALINLGDRFGLGLYDGGKTDPHGLYTIQQQPGQLFMPEPVQPQQQPQQQQQQQQTAPAPQPQGGIQEMREVQQRLQADREEWKAREMSERMQAGLKVDDAGPRDEEAQSSNG